METKKRSDSQDQLEEHSLPGTNQAGRGPGECEEHEEQQKSPAGDSRQKNSHAAVRTDDPA